MDKIVEVTIFGHWTTGSRELMEARHTLQTRNIKERTPRRILTKLLKTGDKIFKAGREKTQGQR